MLNVMIMRLRTMFLAIKMCLAIGICYRRISVNCRYPVNGKRVVNGVTYQYEHGCGQCVSCRINRRRSWTLRILGESTLWPSNTFLTLTYADEQLPVNGSLHKKDFQDFMKRYRKAIYPRKVRYFGCGEYGSRTKRPHYHAIIFNGSLEDEKCIAEAWNLGYSQLSDMTPERAAYVAKYTLKENDGWVKSMDGIVPEFSLMSRMPGVGSDWLTKMSLEAKAQGIMLPSSGLNGEQMNQMLISMGGSLKLGGKSYPLDRYALKKFHEQSGGLASEVRKSLRSVFKQGLGDPISQVVQDVESEIKAAKAARRKPYVKTSEI